MGGARFGEKAPNALLPRATSHLGYTLAKPSPMTRRLEAPLPPDSGHFFALIAPAQNTETHCFCCTSARGDGQKLKPDRPWAGPWALPGGQSLKRIPMLKYRPNGS